MITMQKDRDKKPENHLQSSVKGCWGRGGKGPTKLRKRKELSGPSEVVTFH
jgi:hypothetical protein